MRGLQRSPGSQWERGRRYLPWLLFIQLSLMTQTSIQKPEEEPGGSAARLAGGEDRPLVLPPLNGFCNTCEDSCVSLHCEVLSIPNANSTCCHATGRHSGDTSAMQTRHCKSSPCCHSNQDTKERGGALEPLRSGGGCCSAVWVASSTSENANKEQHNASKVQSLRHACQIEKTAKDCG